MTKTYAQIVKQIETLKQDAERARSKEIAGVVSRIRDAIKAYNLTADDLGLGGAKTASSAASSVATSAAAPMFAKAKPGPKPGFKKAGKPGPTIGFKKRGKPGPKPGFKKAAAVAAAPMAAAASATAAPKKRRGPKPKGNKAPKAPLVVKFRNDSGGTWGGMGKRPDWLRAALAAGKQLSDFAVK
jgi:DNA-binding protein H-NS